MYRSLPTPNYIAISIRKFGLDRCPERATSLLVPAGKCKALRHSGMFFPGAKTDAINSQNAEERKKPQGNIPSPAHKVPKESEWWIELLRICLRRSN